MAFHSTSERYEYIFGSNARKLEREEEVSGTSRTAAVPARRKVGYQPERKIKRKGPADTKTAKAIQKNRARFLEFDWKYTVMILMAAAICAFAAIFYLHGTARLNVMERQISELKSDKVSLLSEQAALEAEIEKSINLDEIRTYAEEELHMVFPESSTTIQYEEDSGDYFRQYESVDSSK